MICRLSTIKLIMLLVIEKLHNLQYTLALLQYIMQLQVQENKMNEKRIWKVALWPLLGRFPPAWWSNYNCFSNFLVIVHKIITLSIKISRCTVDHSQSSHTYFSAVSKRLIGCYSARHSSWGHDGVPASSVSLWRMKTDTSQ